MGFYLDSNINFFKNDIWIFDMLFTDNSWEKDVLQKSIRAYKRFPNKKFVDLWETINLFLLKELEVLRSVSELLVQLVQL